jgi:hypothetical protein
MPMSMTINIKGHWDGVKHEHILAVLADAVRVLAAHFDSRPAVITVKPGNDQPIALFGSDPTIQLTARQQYWCQYSYQFGHELCHLLTNHNRLKCSPSGHFQIDEIICEAAAIFTVLKLAERWAKDPPWPELAPYATSMESYGQDILSKYTLKPKCSIYDDPQNNALDRDRNGYVAVKLLNLLMIHPEYWRATQSLPMPTSTVTEFLTNWQKVCPEKEAVKALAAIFSAEI